MARKKKAITPPDIMRDQPVLIRIRWIAKPDQKQSLDAIASDLWEDYRNNPQRYLFPSGSGGCTGSLECSPEGEKSYEEWQHKTIDEMTPEEAHAFLLDCKGGHTQLMAMLGHFWYREWSRAEKEAWVSAVMEKARLAQWPIDGLDAHLPTWTKKAEDYKFKAIRPKD